LFIGAFLDFTILVHLFLGFGVFAFSFINDSLAFVVFQRFFKFCCSQHLSWFCCSFSASLGSIIWCLRYFFLDPWTFPSFLALAPLFFNTFLGFALLFKLVLPPFVLCIGVGELEVFSCFNSNF
jgi:hypothetical protein